MPDKYYIDLTRFSLNQAQTNLSSAQQYLQEAGDDFDTDEFAYIQTTINRVRRQIDRLGLYPSNKVNDK